MKPEIYISVDIETDGPIPGDYSMLSIGAVAFRDNGEELSSFSMNIVPLTRARQHPKHMEFWAKHPEAWEATISNQQTPLYAMIEFKEWLSTWDAPVFVGYPASFDFSFVHWYFHHFLEDDPFGFSALDIKTLAMAMLKTSFRGAVKRNMPKEWKKPKAKHSHVAVEDALEQGYLFFKVLDALSKE